MNIKKDVKNKKQIEKFVGSLMKFMESEAIIVLSLECQIRENIHGGRNANYQEGVSFSFSVKENLFVEHGNLNLLPAFQAYINTLANGLDIRWDTDLDNVGVSGFFILYER